MKWASVMLCLAPLLCGQKDDHEHGPVTFTVLLEQLVSASRERFRPVMTYRVDMRPRGNSWYEAKYILPEAQSCRVYEHPQLRYVCEWSAKPKRDFDQFVKTYEEGLGKGWQRTEVPGRVRTVRFTATERTRNGDIEITDAATGIRLTMFAVT
ncbi:MAG: hypothetical protein JNK48_12325 [Bryobacterales bacterium]|nr:hypothetical protein [Bryobacterales bacterium]